MNSLEVCAVLERDVAAGAGANRVDRLRLIEHVARADVEQSLVFVGRRDRDARHAGERPEQFAVEIVGADLAGSRRHDFGALAVLPDERRRPVALLVARHAQTSSPVLASRASRYESSSLSLTK